MRGQQAVPAIKRQLISAVSIVLDHSTENNDNNISSDSHNNNDNSSDDDKEKSTHIGYILFDQIRFSSSWFPLIEPDD